MERWLKETNILSLSVTFVCTLVEVFQCKFTHLLLVM